MCTNVYFNVISDAKLLNNSINYQFSIVHKLLDALLVTPNITPLNTVFPSNSIKVSTYHALFIQHFTHHKLQANILIKVLLTFIKGLKYK